MGCAASRVRAAPEGREADPLLFDLVIVGAGYAGLCALEAAVGYHKRGHRIAIVDRRHSWGGHWVEQYGFVTLHQPRQQYTPGNEKWPDKDQPERLATKSEVLAHFERCARKLSRRASITCLFGHEYDENAALINSESGAPRLHLSCSTVDTGCDIPKSTHHITARGLIRALGHSTVPLRAPLVLSSSRVRSVAICDPIIESPSTAGECVYLVGSGKTALDVANHILASPEPPAKLVLITGRGVCFMNREMLFPSGAPPPGAINFCSFVHRLVLMAGEKSPEALPALIEQLKKEGFLLSPSPHAEVLRNGIASPVEVEAVAAGATFEAGHLLDVSDDGAAGPRLVIRRLDGCVQHVPIEEGALVVNCTSNYPTGEHAVRLEPLLSCGGRVLTTRSELADSGTTANLLTSLWCRGTLDKISSELVFACSNGRLSEGAKAALDQAQLRSRAPLA